MWYFPIHSVAHPLIPFHPLPQLTTLLAYQSSIEDMLTQHCSVSSEEVLASRAMYRSVDRKCESNVCVCVVYIYMCVCVYVVCIYMCVRVCMWCVYMYACACVYVWCIYICVCVYVWCIYISVCVCCVCMYATPGTGTMPHMSRVHTIYTTPPHVQLLATLVILSSAMLCEGHTRSTKMTHHSCRSP